MPAKTEKQAQYMRAVAHGWKPKKGKGPSPSVARHFMHVKEQAAKRFGGQADRLRSFGAQRGTTIGRDVSRRSGFTGTQNLDVARRGGFQGTLGRDAARGEGRFGKMNPDRNRAFTQRTRLRPSTPNLRRRTGELRMNNKKHEGSPLKEKKMNNFIHNPYQISPETMVNEDYSRRIFEDSFDAADKESKATQADLDRKRLEVKHAREQAKAATKRLLALRKDSGDSQHDHMEYKGELQNEVTKKRKKAQEKLEAAARENKPTSRELRRMFRKSGKLRQLDIATTHGGRVPGESYSKK